MSNPEIRTPEDAAETDEFLSRDLATEFANNLNMQDMGGSDKQQSASKTKDWALLKDPKIHNERLEAIRHKKGYVIDMDGVIYHASITLLRCITIATNVIGCLGYQIAAWCQGVGRVFESQ